MKCNKTYSFNVEVVKAFEEEVESQTRSRLLEALMIEFLIKYTRAKSPSTRSTHPITTKDVT